MKYNGPTGDGDSGCASFTCTCAVCSRATESGVDEESFARACRQLADRHRLDPDPS